MSSVKFTNRMVFVQLVYQLIPLQLFIIDSIKSRLTSITFDPACAIPVNLN